MIGFDPIPDRDLRSWTVRSPGEGKAADWTSMMTQPFSLLIGAKLGEQFGWREGQSIKLVHSRQTSDFKVLALLDPNGLALVEGGRIALCDITTFQEFTDQFGLADRIDIRLKPNAAGDALTTLQPLLPAGVVMRSPAERSESGQAMIRAYQLSLTFLSFISLFVSMFLVYSLVALNAAARRRELAVMRATGASGRLLFFLFVGEGAFIGLCGWMLALPISSLLVKTLLAGVSRTVSVLFVRVQVDGLTLDPWEILLSFGVTLTVAMLAALQPAHEAMRVPPREALDVAPSGTIRPRLIRRMALGGVGLLLLVYPIARLPSPPSVSLPGYLAALLLFVGFALLAPLMLQQFGRLLAPRLLRLGGQPAFLAAGYLKQSGIQTAISVGALITAVALFTALVVMIHSFRSTVALWVEQNIAGDIYVRPKLAELNRFRDPLPPRVVAAVQTLPVPVELVPMHRLELSVNDHQHLFEAMDYAAYARRSRFIWMEGQALRQAVLRIFDETFAITTVLLLIALVVAALGIATTLAVLVLQRRRQLNTIRAVGGSAAQLRRMIFWEAGLIVLAGQAAGLACGFILSMLLIFVVNRQSFGWTFIYQVDWPSLLMAVPLIFAAALLAALPAVNLALSTSPAMLLRGGTR